MRAFCPTVAAVQRDDGFDAVVVGSGPNGLVGAVTLASAGLRVLVVEAASTYGGGLRTESLTLPGFRHDVCASVHPLAVSSPALMDLHLESSAAGSDSLEWAYPDVPLAHPLTGQQPQRADAVLLHHSVAQTGEELGVDAERWRRLFAPLVRQAPAIVEQVLDPYRVPPAAALGPGAKFALTGLQSAHRLVGRFRGERAAALLAGNAAHSVLDLRQLPSGGFGVLLAMLAHAKGWPFAVGGSQSIADALVRRLTSLGGEVQCDTTIGHLDELPAAPIVLLDVGPHQLLTMAEGRLPPRYANALSRYRYGPGVFKVDWALDGPVPWSEPRVGSAGTVHLGGTAREIEESERAVQLGRHPEHPFVLFTQPTVADPTRAPDGKHIGWAYCHVPNGSDVDMTAHIEAQVERFAPGFRERILDKHVMGPRQMQLHNANYIGGDIGGGIADVRQLLMRPTLSRRPWGTPIPGVYLCSSSTPPGGGVHGMSGYLAARLALR